MKHGQAGIGRRLPSCLVVPPKAGERPFRPTLLRGSYSFGFGRASTAEIASVTR